MRIGVLGGTFDPIHIGHLWMAEAARDQLALDRVYLVPASRPPHKTGQETTSYEDRLAMTRLAVAGSPGLEASEIERDPSRLSFTADMLRRLHAERPGAEYWLILGGDSLRDLSTWREPEEIVRLAGLAVLPRPGYQTEESPAPGARIEFLAGPQLAVSATELRSRLREGRSARYLVPTPVLRWIERRGLYGCDPGAGT